MTYLFNNAGEIIIHSDTNNAPLITIIGKSSAKFNPAKFKTLAKIIINDPANTIFGKLFKNNPGITSLLAISEKDNDCEFLQTPNGTNCSYIIDMFSIQALYKGNF
ncbi:MAG: hypothetical protein EHV01_005650, partial [Spiroplasma sp. hy2]|uniref:hypothetical protein n=1 Tax=Spiroplasma sp. hy2 TaxID=2490850 RepID=UPI003B72DB8B